VLAAVASSLAGVAVLAIASVLIVGHQLRSSLDAALRQRAQQVAELAVSAPAVLDSPGALESPVSGHQIVVEVIDAHGRIIARSLTLGAELLPQDRLARAARVSGRTGFENVNIGGRQFRLYAAPIADAGGPAAGGAVLVASDTTDITNTINHIGFLLAVIGAAVALVAALVAAALSRRGLRPLRRLATAAEEIEKTADPSKRLPEPAVADEVAQLSGVLNRMLAALEQSRENERRFLADASHELRTPVATLLGNVEYASRHGADEEVLADLRRDADRLARLVDDLLVLERAGEREREPTAVELDELVEEVVHGHDDGAERVRLERVEPVHVRGEPEALRRVLENLIENALVHGPEGGQVTVALTSANGHALLTVRDAGKGPDPANRDRLFERFWRGPDALHRSGSGLGLSIVAAVVERHGGRVLVDGATFTIELPALSAPTGPTAGG
jgi:signal transduction histidine kinase